MSGKILRPHRRKFLQWGAGLSAPVIGSPLWADLRYPTRTLHLIVGFPPGGASGAVAAIVASQFSERLGQKVVVEYRAGAGSRIATRTMLGLPADGHSLLLMGSSTVVSSLLHEGTQPTLLQNILPLAGLTVSAFVIVVNSSTSHTTLSDLIAHAKAEPGKARIGTYGLGTQSHFAAQLFCKSAEIDVTLVPYRGSALMMNDLVGRHIDVAFDSVVSVLPHINSGTLRALAVTTAKRSNHILTEVPAAKEFLPNYEVVTWTGLAVRKGTQLSIVERLYDESIAVLNDPIVRTKLSDLAFDAMLYGRDEFVAFWSEEVRRTRELIREMGINSE